MRYLSCFSGIEAASVAWHPLGWTPVGFSEIDPFASAVLAHRFPKVTNYGDITRHAEWDGVVRGSVDLLVGGSPCQAFSVAGLRRGLDDPRGQLTLVYLQLAARLEPEWIVWENVPGVLSADGGRAFGAFLGGLAELGYGFAWRVLDARHFGVPQRRRRVFLVARRAGDWRSAAAVLLEPKGLRRDRQACGEAREEPARTAQDGAPAGGIIYGGSDQRFSDTVTSKWSKGSGGPSGNETGLFVAHPDIPDTMSTIDGQSGDQSPCNQSVNSGCYIPGHVFGQGSFAQYSEGEFSTLRSSGGDLGGGSETLVALQEQNAYSPHGHYNYKQTDESATLQDRENRIGGHTHLVTSGPEPVVYGIDAEKNASENIIGALCRGGDGGRHEAVAIPIDGRNALRDPEKFDDQNRQGVGVGEEGDPAHTVTTACVHAVAFKPGQSAAARSIGASDEVCPTIEAGGGGNNKPAVALGVDVYNAAMTGDTAATVTSATGIANASGPKVMSKMVVRRLLPVECERLQGFPDNWTDIPYRGKAAPDGPRYKALGNSMAVPCMAWIGRRIQAVMEGRL